MPQLCAPEVADSDVSLVGRPAGPRPARDGAVRPLGAIARGSRRLVLDRFRQLEAGRLEFVDADGIHAVGRPDAEETATITVHDPGMYRRIVLGGGLAAAETYIDGCWDCDDLVQTMRILARHADVLASLDRGAARLLRPLERLGHWWRRNSPIGSRRNISAHYDLSNEFFALMLDSTMTYSSGWFAGEETTLEQASRAKYERICRKLRLQPDDHVLEIGCGWGGFALYAARHYGCRVTATTISQQQYELARQRVAAEGLSDRIELLQSDYRDLAGRYDKVVSIEMIEAVGEAFLDQFFGQCDRLLRPGGRFALQAITIPDHRYDRYRRSVDFIQRFVFPGGFLPSFSAIGQSLRRATRLRVTQLEDFGPDYATTLAHWKTNFWSRINEVRELGFDEPFIRTWHYYLCYCEAGFRERQIGVGQFLFEK